MTDTTKAYLVNPATQCEQLRRALERILRTELEQLRHEVALLKTR